MVSCLDHCHYEIRPTVLIGMFTHTFIMILYQISWLGNILMSNPITNATIFLSASVMFALESHHCILLFSTCPVDDWQLLINLLKWLLFGQWWHKGYIIAIHPAYGLALVKPSPWPDHCVSWIWSAWYYDWFPIVL